MRDSLTKLFGNHLVNLDMLPDDAVIIDAGACVGEFIKDIQEHIKSPYIFAIEPNKENIKKLKPFFLSDNPILGVVIPATLVGAKEKNEMKFYEIEKLREWGNVTNIYTNKKHKSYMVATINLKALLDTIPLKTIHYLKMDIEGSEWDVVNDMNEDTAKRIKQMSIDGSRVFRVDFLSEDPPRTFGASAVLFDKDMTPFEFTNTLREMADKLDKFLWRK